MSIVAAVVLASCVSLLVVDHVRWSMVYPTQREALEVAEDAARQDAESAEQFHQLIETQTRQSLTFKRRERWASMLALVAAGGLIWSLRGPSVDKPSLPSTLAEAMPRRVPPTSDPESSTDDLSTLTVSEPSEPEVDLAAVRRIVERVGRDARQLIPLLHEIQHEYRYLPAAALDELCRLTDITPTQVASVSSFYTRFRTKPCGKHLVEVCRGTACHVAGADRVLEELRRGLGIPAGTDTDAARMATVEDVGCMGCCTLATAVKVDGQLFAHVRVEDLPEILDECRDKPKDRRGYKPSKKAASRPAQEESTATLLTAPEMTGSNVVTQLWPHLTTGTLDEYEQQGGFAALAKCLSAGEQQSVIDQIERSGLRGRGGGGFPTARKWRLVSEQVGDKFVVCNGDEGDPGAFMDRSIMESAPASVLEGMLLAAWAVGASRGIVYVRNEYPLAVERLRETVGRMREKGLLGDNIFGCKFAFDIDVIEGAGAFVCGEETALIESVMGNRGTPHYRPPYPAVSGLWERPTLVNNVETLACVPWIIRHGADAFSSVGTAGSKGTKVFSLAGKIQQGGLVEAPMGTTIRELVEQYGGGVAPGRTFKAVQIGGPSGGCIPAALSDTPIDYEALRELGAIMGSGGLVVLDDTDCMVDVARYFLEFTQQESCGHCTFCRVGTRKLLDMLERLCSGKASRHELDDIAWLAQSVTDGSLCGLGKTAPNPVVTTLKYFRDEYEAHLEGRCPAGRCKSLIQYKVTRDCVGCTLCAQHCPVAAIEATPYRQHVIDTQLCTCCDACRTTCPEHAIVTISPGKSHKPKPEPKVPKPEIQVA
ncbi:MAG: NAD(P)H-dependent oxidoreductase subunit E [Planctomycetales bacterium]|nr:NAD(P)H-dependent oxidoreductase subunit E [Planctomycetales bacterium]